MIIKYLPVLKVIAFRPWRVEVTDLNNYLRSGELSCEIIDWWIDAGTSYDELNANLQVATMVKEGKL